MELAVALLNPVGPCEIQIHADARSVPCGLAAATRELEAYSDQDGGSREFHLAAW